MGRRRLEVGEHGQIKVTLIGPKHYRARCEVRCRDGRVRSVQADGPSKTAATDTVKARAVERAQSAGRAMPGADVAELTPATKVAILADKWWEQKQPAVSEQSARTYEPYHRAIKDAIGELQIREVTTSTVEWLIDREAAGRPAKAKGFRRQVSEMFAIAIRHDAYDGANPAREVELEKSDRAATRVLSLEELAAYRKHIQAWQDAPARQDGRRGGRQRVKDLLDYVDIQLATSARVNEVLALRWSDIDLESEVPTAHICGTLVARKKADGGLYRQEHRKSKDRYTVILPRFAVDTLLRMKVHAVPNDWDVIFPSSTGTLRSDSNLRTQLRAAQGTEWSWVKTHTFRKTVATLVAREVSVEAASAQLGHSGIAVTEQHYIQRATAAPDLRATLDKLGPTVAEESQEYPRN